MSEFTPITTQEQLNEIIGERVSKVKLKYEGYISPDELNKIKADYDKQIADMNSAAEASAKKYADFDKQLADRDAKIKGYESHSVKTRIAHELGLPYGAAEYLKGDDEKSIKESAEAFKSLLGTNNRRSAPLGSNEPGGKSTERDQKNAEYKALLADLMSK